MKKRSLLFPTKVGGQLYMCEGGRKEKGGKGQYVPSRIMPYLGGLFNRQHQQPFQFHSRNLSTNKGVVTIMLKDPVQFTVSKSRLLVAEPSQSPTILPIQMSWLPPRQRNVLSILTRY